MSGSSPRSRRSRSGRSSLVLQPRLPARQSTWHGFCAGLPSTQIGARASPCSPARTPGQMPPRRPHIIHRVITSGKIWVLEARVGSAELTMPLGTCTVLARDSTTPDWTDAPQRRRAGHAGRRVRRTATLGDRASDRGRRVLRRRRSRAGVAGAHHGRHRVARRGRVSAFSKASPARPKASGGSGSRP